MLREHDVHLFLAQTYLFKLFGILIIVLKVILS